ncbi:hypothetical protein DERF_008761 [Dermatophagoides farinae]|uniref:Uncharacterized protein n=1 Tax=Dermatophagoides farinae TaxID=6954 RepID=A0A922I6E8_DERFA|nr:hypothetical protein DERF_008761 [Dermatophagoides farinae]
MLQYCCRKQKPIRQEIVNLNGSLGSRSFCCKMNHSLLVNIRASMLRLFTNKPVPLSKPLCVCVYRSYRITLWVHRKKTLNIESSTAVAFCNILSGLHHLLDAKSAAKCAELEQ